MSVGSDGNPARQEIEITIPELSFIQLAWSDYEVTLRERAEPRWLSVALWPIRLMMNPSLLLALSVRIAQKGPGFIRWPIRWIQLVMFSSEIHGFAGENPLELGPAVAFPHPTTILIGAGVKIGAGVTLYNNVTLGANRHLPRARASGAFPRLGDRSVVYGYCNVQGPYDVGHDAVLGIRVVLDSDVPPGALLTINRLRLKGEWPGEVRTHWAGLATGS